MHPGSPPPSLPAERSRPWLALAGLVAGVLVAHGLLLTGLPVGVGPVDHGGPRPLQARQIVLPAVHPPPPTADALPLAPVPRPARPPVPRPVLQPRPASLHASVEPPDVALQAAIAPDAVPPSAAVPMVSAGEAEAPPVYATRLPPATELSYDLRRGVLTGHGALSWRPGADAYELQIEGFAFGMPLLGWLSRGGYDAAGLAPQRFVDRRRGRDVRAANFQRDKGLITWSGVAHQAPLAVGAQDRLSWIVQLAAVLQAEPQHLATGERVVMQVAGARGDADLWAFVVQGHEPVDVVGGRIHDTVLLRREPRKPFDTRVEVWLDPARHHLPVRLKLSTAGGGDSLEFLLRP